MKVLNLLPLFKLVLLLGSIACAQERGSKQADEVIVRVNSGVIMRSAFESAQQEYLDQLKRQGLKGAELEKKFNELKPRILDELINRQFLVQQAKALSIDVQPEADRLFLLMMKENDCESIINTIRSERGVLRARSHL